VNKDPEGNDVDYSIQMDVDEYFNTMMARVEETLKGTPQVWKKKKKQKKIQEWCLFYFLFMFILFYL